MRSVSRPLKLVLAVVIGLAMSAAFSASAHATEATWDLSDGEQRVCIPAQEPYTTYFVGFIAGSWDTALVPEVSGLPEGTDISMTPSVAPGDNGDRYTGTVWLLVKLPPLEYGEYSATLAVSDGTATQTMPIVIKAQEAWGC